MIRLRIVTLALALVVIGAAVAPGQERSTEVESAPIPGWTFVPGVAVGTLYDDNVLVTTSIDPTTGQPPTDVLFSIDPTGSLNYYGRRTKFDASYRGTLRQYRTLDGLNGFDQHAGASVERRATKRVTLFGQNLFTTVPTTDELDVTGVPFTRAGARTYTLGAGVRTRLTEHTDWETHYDYRWVAFDRTAPDLTGGAISAVRTAVSQRLTKRLKVGGEGSVRFASMDVDGGRHLQFQDVGGTMSYALTEFTEVSGAAGFSHLRDERDEVTRSGPYFRAQISKIAANAVFGAGYEQSFVPSFGFGGTTRTQHLSGWIDLPPIGHRLYLRGSGSLRRNDPFEPQDVRMKTLLLRATVGYAIARTIRAQGFYAFSRHNSIVQEIETNRNRIGAELVFFQPMRIR